MIKNLLRILIVLLIIVAGVGIYFYFFSNNSQVTPNQSRDFPFFPFGNIFNNQNQDNNENPDTNPDTSPVVNRNRTPRIIQLSNESVAGATLFLKNRPVDESTLPSFTFVDFTTFPLMRLGFEGEEVSKLENILTLIETGAVGESEKTLFDEETKTLVSAFQSNNNLTADGIAGQNTFIKINQAEEALLEGGFESILAARYIKRDSGEVVDIFTDTLETEVVSDTIIPRIYEAYFGQNENSVLLRYLRSDNETIETFGGDIAEGSITGDFFPQNIPFTSISPDKTKVFYLVKNGDYVEGVISAFKNTSITPVFEHPFTEWIPDWGTDSSITLTTKASWDTNGFAYSLDKTNGKLTKILSDKRAVTTLTAPNGRKVLYGVNENGNYQLYVYDKNTEKETKLGLQTFPEKCVWYKNSINVLCGAPNNLFSSQQPDSWYQGRTSFTDAIWILDTDSNAHQLVLDPEREEGLRHDITKLQLDEKEEFLIYTDKTTSILYGAKLQ